LNLFALPSGTCECFIYMRQQRFVSSHVAIVRHHSLTHNYLRELGIPVLVEGERLRPGLEGLLALADYVVTSAHFPQVCPSLATVSRHWSALHPRNHNQ